MQSLADVERQAGMGAVLQEMHKQSANQIIRITDLEMESARHSTRITDLEAKDVVYQNDLVALLSAGDSCKRRAESLNEVSLRHNESMQAVSRRIDSSQTFANNGRLPYFDGGSAQQRHRPRLL